MKQCPYCGSELEEEAKFCVECGRSLPEDAPAAEAPAEEPAQAPVEPDPVPAAEAESAAPVEPAVTPAEATVIPPAEMPVVTQLPPKKQMLSTVQYILLSLLYALPVIGLVFLFIFGAGHPRNISLKRFSAAMLILRLVFWIVLLALLIVAMVKNGRLLVDSVGQFIPALESLLKAFFA